MIVLDVGCQEHSNEESTRKLIERFQPDLYLGFDPCLLLPEGVERIGSTLVVRRRAAVWLHGGEVEFYVHGIDGGVERSAQSETVEAVDLGALIEALPVGGLVVKFDCEGSEFPLLQHLHDTHLDRKLDLVLVEYHFPTNSHGWYVEPESRPVLECPMEPW